jgi:hypothetical protein
LLGKADIEHEQLPPCATQFTLLQEINWYHEYAPELQLYVSQLHLEYQWSLLSSRHHLRKHLIGHLWWIGGLGAVILNQQRHFRRSI